MQNTRFSNINYIVKDKNDYDQVINSHNKEFLCYSTKLIKTMYPTNDFEVIGEVCLDSQPSQTDAKYIVTVNNTEIMGYEDDHFSNVLYRKIGYLNISDNKYIIVMESRLPFITKHMH